MVNWVLTSLSAIFQPRNVTQNEASTQNASGNDKFIVSSLDEYNPTLSSVSDIIQN